MWKKLSFRRSRPVEAGRPTPFEVACRCGEVQRGRRMPERQILRCPSCGASVFVLPQSAWPAGEGGTASPETRVRVYEPEGKNRVWLALILAIGATLAVLGLTIGVLWHRILDAPPNRQTQAVTQAVAEHLRDCREALRLGDLKKARSLVHAATEIITQAPKGTSLPGAAEVRHLRSQVDLLTELIDRPLEEILAEAKSMPADEWQRRWRQSYQGRAVAFDADLWLNANGDGLHFDYLLPTELDARIDLGNLGDLKTRLAVRRAERLFFGARLASLRPEEPDGAWVFRFENLVVLDERALRSVILGEYHGPTPNTLCVSAESRKVAEQHGVPERIATQLFSRGTVEQWVYKERNRHWFRHGPVRQTTPLQGPTGRPGP